MTLPRALLRGGLGFAVVSAAAFSIWAFGGGWFKLHGGDPAMYTTITAAFVGLSGLLLYRLVQGPRSLIRFYAIFVPAFLAYAAAWCAAWYWLKSGPGEWLASLAGSVAFALVSAALFRNLRSFLQVAIVLFLHHSAGYFLGEVVWARAHHSTTGMLVWGGVYGLCFGAGIGAAFFTLQAPKKNSRESS